MMHAFTEEEAITCKGDTFAMVKFISHLLAKGMYAGVPTKDALLDLWDIGPERWAQIFQQAKAVYRSALEEHDQNLRDEAAGTLQTVRVNAYSEFLRLRVEEPKSAQKYLATALDAAAKLMALLPKDGKDGQEVAKFIVELTSAERPKSE